MLEKRNRPAVLAVLATVLLLSSSVAGIAVADQPSTTIEEEDDVDGEEVIDSFVQRIETLETVEFERTSESTFNGNTTTTTVQVAVDLQDFQKRIDIVESPLGSNTTTVINESKSVTYDPSHDSVSEYEVSGEQILLPQLELLANESTVDYEFNGTETIDGQSAYVLDATPAQQADDDVELSMTVYVDTETHFPVQIVSETVTGDSTYSSTVTFRNVSVNQEIPDSTFELDLPDDVSSPTEEFAPDITSYDSHSALASNTAVSVPDTELANDFKFDSATVISSEDHRSVFIGYDNGDQSISVTTRAETTGSVDRSDQERYEAVTIGETTGYVYSHDDFTAVSWTTGQSYTVSGDLSEEEAIEIAESIEDE